MQDPINIEKKNPATGPRTEEGKKRSSQNAVTHALFTQKLVLLKGETQEQFDAIHEGYIIDHKPHGTTEESLVYRLAVTFWRIQRATNLEARAMQKAEETGDAECKGTEKWALYSQRLASEFKTTLKTLNDQQAGRLLAHGQDYRAAVLMYDYYKRNKIPWDPAGDGFVFSIENLDRQLTFNQTWRTMVKEMIIYPTTKYMDERFSKEAL